MDEKTIIEKVNMSTMVTIVESLAGNGYRTQFKVTDEGFTSLDTHELYSADQVKINNFYRFEGESNPDDSSILSAIETNAGIKGTLIDSYGAYSDPLINSFIQDVESIHK